MTTSKIQDTILLDVSGSGRPRPWRKKKISSNLLACAYEEMDPIKAARVRDCASQISFAYDPETGKRTLTAANFCRVRLCPMCSWRRSLKIAAQMTKVLAAIAADREPVAYIFATFTIRNCGADQLADKLLQMSAGWNRLVGYKAIKSATLGAYRGTEITCNRNAGTYHPHFHVIFAVRPAYFKKGDYIDHDEWVRLWRRAMRLDYDPQVDVRRVKGDTSKAVAEVAKYAVKDTDYIDPNDWQMTLETIALLDVALANRRFIAFTGIFKDWHKRLNLDDAEDGDLVHEDTNEDLTGQVQITYAWNVGLHDYYIRAE